MPVDFFLSAINKEMRGWVVIGKYTQLNLLFFFVSHLLHHKQFAKDDKFFILIKNYNIILSIYSLTF